MVLRAPYAEVDIKLRPAGSLQPNIPATAASEVINPGKYARRHTW